MSTILFALHDRIITDRGEVVFSYENLIQRVLSGKPISHLTTVPHPDVEKYAYRRGQEMSLWEDDGQVEGPDQQTFEWITPEPYRSCDIEVMCLEAIESRSLGREYLDRFEREWSIVESRGMVDFLRCLVYVTDTMRKNKTVWGLGRGSSCASLVLFLLRVNKVDPVRYDIPMEEFYK